MSNSDDKNKYKILGGWREAKEEDIDLSYTPGALGALPPKRSLWKIGKTAASIAFVQEAEAFLEGCADPETRNLLEDEICEIKSGKKDLTDWLTVSDFLKSRVQ